MTEKILFVSEQCQHSKSLLSEIEKRGLHGLAEVCYLEDYLKNRSMPTFIKQIPSLISVEGQKIIDVKTGKEVFDWMFLNKHSSGMGKPSASNGEAENRVYSKPEEIPNQPEIPYDGGDLDTIMEDGLSSTAFDLTANPDLSSNVVVDNSYNMSPHPQGGPIAGAIQTPSQKALPSLDSLIASRE